MDRLEQALDYVREAAGLAKKEEKKCNVFAIIGAVVLVIAVIAAVAYVVYKFVAPADFDDYDDFDDEFFDDDNDDFFEDEEEDIPCKSEPVPESTEELVSEKSDK